MTSTMTEVEKEFTVACENTAAECRLLGYDPSEWMRMVKDHGAVEAARRLIKASEIQDGLKKLLRMGHVELTVEHAVLDERWRDLFTQDERNAAEWRLKIAQHEW